MKPRPQVIAPVAMFVLVTLASVVSVAALSCGGSTGCSATSKIVQNGLVCAGQQVDLNLITEVAGDLYTRNFAALEQLVVAKGIAFVNCVVQDAVASQPQPAAGSGSGTKLEANPIVTNGNQWLSSHAGSGKP